MAKSHETSSKKEVAKKKREKKREKAERKELRQAGAQKGLALEDMLAFVDENGNLSATPPDPRKKKEIRAEDIPLGASGNNAAEEEPVKTGVVASFDTAKGYGFIRETGSGISFFVHTSDVLTPIKEGDKVSFETEKGPRGMKAVRVSRKGS